MTDNFTATMDNRTLDDGWVTDEAYLITLAERAVALSAAVDAIVRAIAPRQ